MTLDGPKPKRSLVYPYLYIHNIQCLIAWPKSTIIDSDIDKLSNIIVVRKLIVAIVQDLRFK